MAGRLHRRNIQDTLHARLTLFYCQQPFAPLWLQTHLYFEAEHEGLNKVGGFLQGGGVLGVLRRLKLHVSRLTVEPAKRTGGSKRAAIKTRVKGKNSKHSFAYSRDAGS